LKLTYDESLSSFGFNFNLRRYVLEPEKRRVVRSGPLAAAAAAAAAANPVPTVWGSMLKP
jgi:hypothetical protein